ncbi:MAG: rhodanese-like domain-containing protein [Gemmatimonadota bacterium]
MTESCRQSRYFLLFLALALLPASSLAQTPAASSAEPTIGESVPVSGGAYWNISVPELQALLSEKDFQLVNVHVPFQGDLPNTELSIPFDQIGDRLDQLPADRNAMVVLYCRSGTMSVRAATTLAEKGYTQIYNLVGGFRAWSEAGLPMANP